ncbi:MAG: protein-glutamate O-methyltransferase CheR [Clostridiales Family XIII bacterium]|jgi:chemotaxis protein methyltransferase CheR|nr:protein-glutamate O-methyltransferase CheR [Clostridiales Family XIII bacterium]
MIPPLTDAEFHEISEYIHSNYGVNLRKKRQLIEGRLGIYVWSLGFGSYHDYFMYAMKDPLRREFSNLISRLTTNHSFFMREKEHFEFYRDQVLPWVDAELGDSDLRVWSAGCSSGQEPYTLSIVTLEYYSNNGNSTRSSLADISGGGDSVAPPVADTVILASDISEEALIRARRGVYPASELDALPEAWRGAWFERVGEGCYRVSDALRANVAFKRSNLLDAFGARKPFHLIMCRNVMIYFDNETKNRVVNRFYDALRPGGYLLIGHSESLSPGASGFDYIRPSIYRKPL